MRFRKIDPRIWNDAKFHSLSDKGKLAFLLLLTHPETTAIGTLRASVAGLEMDLKGFGEGFKEAFAKGLVKGSNSMPLMFIPNFLKYNRPENPNCVKAWRAALENIPECDLYPFVVKVVKEFAEGLPESFKKAFLEVLPKPFTKGLANPEPEPEPELEPQTSKPPAKLPAGGKEGLLFDPQMQVKPKKPRKAKTAKADEEPKINAWGIWIDVCREQGLKDPVWQDVDGAAGKNIAKAIGDPKKVEHVFRMYLQDRDKWLLEHGHGLRYIGARVNRYLNDSGGVGAPGEVWADDVEAEAIITGKVETPF